MAESFGDTRIEAEYTLESGASCPCCHEQLNAIQVERVLRTKVNFVSALPRRGQVMICPKCRAVLAGSLGGVI